MHITRLFVLVPYPSATRDRPYSQRDVVQSGLFPARVIFKEPVYLYQDRA